MKRRIFLLLLVTALLTTSAGAIYAFSTTEPSSANAAISTDPSTAVADATKPVQGVDMSLVGPENSLALQKRSDYLIDYNNSIGTPEETKVGLDIPVYNEFDILYNSAHSYQLIWRNAKRSGFYFPRVRSLFALFPTNALRVRADGSSYAVYDSDTGYRLYLFLDPKNNIITGWPIIIKKGEVRSLSDFKDINIGDPIDKVEAVDVIVSRYEKLVDEQWKVKVAYYDLVAKKGEPFHTYHYCKDGILRIEYNDDATLEGVNLIVTNIILYKDFMVENYDGTMVNQKILDIDLPLN